MGRIFKRIIASIVVISIMLNSGLAEIISYSETIDVNKIYQVAKSAISDFEIEEGILIKYKGKKEVVKIPDEVTIIGKEAFKDNKKIKEVDVPKSVTSIEDSAFKGCENLEKISLKEGLFKIGNNAFEDCKSMKIIIIPEGTSILGEGIFKNCTSLKGISLPEHLLQIGDKAFQGCENIETITIPIDISLIEKDTFKDCKSLKNVIILNKELSMSSEMFENIDNIKFYGQKNSLVEQISKEKKYNFEEIILCEKVDIKNSKESLSINENETAKLDLTIEPKNANEPIYIIADDEIVEVTDKNTIKALKSGSTEISVFTSQSEVKTVNVDVNKSNKISEDNTTSNEANIKSSKSDLTYNDYTYTVYNGEVTITGYSGSDTDIVIPSSINDIPVTSIGKYAFYECSSLSSIEIPNSVTSIGIWAFAACSSLSSIEIPNSVTNIQARVFSGCSSLSSIEIPSSVTSIESLAFSGCSSLSSIEIPSSVTSIEENAFEQCEKLTNINVDDDNNNYKSIDGVLYSKNGKTLLICPGGKSTSIEIPDSVTRIGNRAFYFCSKLSSIEIPDSVTTIGEDAFYGCSSLSSIEISDSVTDIGYGAFYNCSSLSSIEIPNGVFRINGRTFWGCSSLSSIEIPNSVIVIDAQAFWGCSSLSSIKIPNSVTAMGDSIFGGCSSLSSIEIPNSVTRIPNGTFDGCSSLSSIEIPNSVTRIGERAFSGCSSLSSIEIPNSVTSIGDNVFAGCSSLSSIEIPDSVTVIRYGTFSECSSLSSIEIPNSVTSIGNYVFYGCSSLSSIEIPNSVTSIGELTFYRCEKLTSINVSEDNKNYKSVNGILYSKDGKSLLSYPNGKTGSIEVLDTATSIGESAFSGCSSISSIKIPNGVTSIGESAFSECSNLSSIKLSSNLTSIGDSAFRGCGFDTISIPMGITSIKSYTFYESKLKSIYIPSSVTSIAYNAFMGVNPTIYGIEGSFAQEFASNNNFNFKVIDNSYFEEYFKPKDTFLEFDNKNTYIDLNSDQNIFLNFQSDSINPNDIEFKVSDESIIEIHSINVEIDTSNPYDAVITLNVESEAKEGECTIIAATSDGKTATCTVEVVDKAAEKKMIDNINKWFRPENISIESVKGPTFEIFDINAALMELEGGISFENFDMKKNIDRENQIIEVLIGIGKSLTSSPYEDVSDKEKELWNDTFSDVVSAIKEPENVESLNKLNNIVEKKEVNLLGNAKGNLFGYLKFTYDDSYEITSYTEGGLLLAVMAPIYKEQRIINFPVAYYRYGLDFSLQTGITLKNEKENKVVPNFNLDTNVGILGGLGIGARAANTYLEGVARGDFHTTLDSANLPETDPFRIDFTGSITFKAEAIGFTLATKKFEFAKFPLYPSNDSTGKNNLKSSSIYKISKPTDSQLDKLKPISRDYLKSKSNKTNLKTTSNTSFTKTSIYPYNNPEFVTLENGTSMLVWIDDDGTKSDENRTSLMYSIYDGNSWSETKQIAETGTYNRESKVYVYNNKVYILWSKASKIWDENTSFSDKISSMELYYTVYENGEFTEPVLVNDIGNTAYETNFDIAVSGDKVGIVWTENSENDIFLDEGDNNLYFREFKDNGYASKKVLIDSNSDGFGEIVCDYENSNISIGYTKLKANSEDTAISDIFIYSLGRSKKLSNSDSNNYELQIVNGDLYYLKGGELKIYDISSSTISDGNITGINNYEMLVNGDKKAMVVTKPEEDGFDMVASYYDNETGKWGEFVTITDYNQYIRKHSLVLNSNGKITGALSLAEMPKEEESNSGGFGTASLVVTDLDKFFDLEIGNFYYYRDTVKPNSDLGLHFTVTNNSQKQIDKLNVTILDSNDKVIQKSSIDCLIDSGKTKELTYAYKLPETISYSEIKVKITSNYEESNLDNNIISTAIGYADINLDYVEVMYNEGVYTAFGPIKNTGFTDAKNVKVSIYDTNKEGELIDTLELGTIEAGKSNSINFDIPESLLSSSNDQLLLYFDITSDTQESSLGNNSYTLVFKSSDYEDENTPPVIEANDLVLKVGDKFKVLEGVTASDKEDGDITANIKVIENTVNIAKVGVYKVVYEVKDSNESTVTKEIKVTVNNIFVNFTVNSINNKSTEISGKGVSGATVKAYVGTKQIGNTATVNSSGNYKITIPTQAANTNIVVKMSKSGYETSQKNIKVNAVATKYTKVLTSDIYKYDAGKGKYLTYINGKGYSQYIYLNKSEKYAFTPSSWMTAAGLNVTMPTSKNAYTMIIDNPYITMYNQANNLLNKIKSNKVSKQDISKELEKIKTATITSEQNLNLSSRAMPKKTLTKDIYKYDAGKGKYLTYINGKGYSQYSYLNTSGKYAFTPSSWMTAAGLTVTMPTSKNGYTMKIDNPYITKYNNVVKEINSYI